MVKGIYDLWLSIFVGEYCSLVPDWLPAGLMIDKEGMKTEFLSNITTEIGKPWSRTCIYHLSPLESFEWLSLSGMIRVSFPSHLQVLIPIIAE